MLAKSLISTVITNLMTPIPCSLFLPYELIFSPFSQASRKHECHPDITT